ncbi:FAD-dependent oxidoreductase [Paenibacillus sp. 598K]|uniref:FAD-dependent oxidoreductase n=1 Tax=Paenibacillus sp. 598K TaxID=1117987 RepID=UPI0021A9D8F0|nr:FAD-dependent oxidoreductase [Paenibacillus sp. 598K]
MASQTNLDRGDYRHHKCYVSIFASRSVLLSALQSLLQFLCALNRSYDTRRQTVCLSSSHIAFGSIRMEPVFMILGQSAATAAALALEADVPVQDVDYGRLRARLEQDGQMLDWPL